jgi:hypothetical protein
VVDRLVGLRVNAEDEVAGLDEPEMGSSGYPEDVVAGVRPVENELEGGPAGVPVPAMASAPEPA